MKKMTFAAATLVGANLVLAGMAHAQPNPSQADTNNARNNPCSDPWVSLAVSVVKTQGGAVGRAAGSGNTGECDVALYGGGQWSSYADLLQKVRATRAALASQNVQFALVGGQGLLTLIDPGRGLNAANIVGAGAGNIVGAGAGNIVGAGAGNIVGAGAGNVVSPGYSLQSADGARFSFRLPNGGSLRVRQ